MGKTYFKCQFALIFFNYLLAVLRLLDVRWVFSILNAKGEHFTIICLLDVFYLVIYLLPFLSNYLVISSIFQLAIPVISFYPVVSSDYFINFLISDFTYS
jgi:hypothetical protein